VAGAGYEEGVQEQIEHRPGGEDAPPDLAVVLAFAPPEFPEPASPGRKAGVRALVRFAIASSVHRLVVHDHLVRAGDDPEAVHQARVATRRLRSDLQTFGSVLEPAWTDELRTELAWLGDLLGRVRDADVMIDRLTGRSRELPDVDRAGVAILLDRLRRERTRDRDELLDAMISPRYLSLVDRLAAAARRPRFVVGYIDQSARTEARRLARRPWKKLRRAVRALPDHPTDEQLHEVRKRAKRARYALDATRPVASKPVRRLARRVTELQDVLGEQHDAVVAGAWLRTAAVTTGDSTVAYAAGELAGSFARDATHRRHEWRRCWNRARRRAADVF
jgi:CHAD domain-containing protein